MTALLTDGIIGHAHVLRLLEKWLEKPGFAYLFNGPSHLGKNLVAERFVRALAGTDTEKNLRLHPDIVVFEAEEGKKEVSVKQVREARSRLYARPQFAPRMVAYLPCADRLNDEGFNALLKVMEEPPADAVFVGVAENLSRIPATILSRMVRVPFRLVPHDEIVIGLKSRGLTQDSAQTKADTARGRPGFALLDEDPFAPFRAAAEKYAIGPKVGNRLAAIERMHKACESCEDANAAWRDALESCMQAVRGLWLTDSRTAYVLGQGIADATSALGGPLGPRPMLEAGALRVGMDRLPTPNIYPKIFPLSLKV